MSAIISTEAVVLNTYDFSNTSKIVVLYTQKLGKISALIKAGRDKNSKIGRTADILNLISIVLYNKDVREVQLLTQADMVAFFGNIREDYDSLLHAHAVLELFQYLVKEHEENQRLYAGLRKILYRFDQKAEPPPVTFLRFFIFFIELAGYELSTEFCSNCGRTADHTKDEAGLNNTAGVLCSDCAQKIPHTVHVSQELFNALHCLKSGNRESDLQPGGAIRLISMLESFLKYQIPEFQGLKSIKSI